MKLWKSLSATFISALHHPFLWMLQFVGNALIILIFILWLHIPDAHWWQLLFQLVIFLGMVVGALWLHGGTLNYYSDVYEEKNAGLLKAFKNGLKHLFAFAISIAVLIVLLWLTFKLNHFQYELPGYLRSEMPAWLRRHISEPAMDNLYEGFVFVVFWVVVPGLILPLCLLCARIGFRGFLNLGAWWRAVRNLAFWIVLVVAALIGVYCFGKIISHWRLDPKTATLRGEESFVAFRFPFAYLLALFSWLWVCCMTVRACFRPEPPPAESQKAAA